MKKKIIIGILLILLFISLVPLTTTRLYAKLHLSITFNGKMVSWGDMKGCDCMTGGKDCKCVIEV
jgi:hypothetical protein